MKSFLQDKWQRFQAVSLRKKLAVAGILSMGFLILTPLVTYAYFARDINNPERLMNRNSTGIVLLDRNDQAIYSFGKTKTQEIIPLSGISDDLEKALIASEDKDFYNHPGFSARGMAAALYSNILNRDATRYGGSTITQQLVKNTLLTSEKNYLRKYQELSIAIAVDRQYTKDEILQMYLNSVYFGEGAFGVEAAAKAYFNKKPSELNLAESSMLVGLLPAPSAYSPISGSIEDAKKQQEVVLSRMVDEEYITTEQKEAAISSQLSYAEPEALEDKAPHFTQMVLAELNERYGEEQVTRSGYQVKTTLDLKWQEKAQAAIDERIESIQAQGGSNAAMVVTDPGNGEIRVLIGSEDWNNPDYGKVNMAVTPRQPGSSFKPIYYTEALSRGIITPATIIRDERKTYGDFKPENYDFRFRGDITVRNALATSLNIPAVEVMQKLGVKNAVNTAQRMGIDTIEDGDNHGLSLALGSAEAKLTDMTNAYAAFANQGEQFEQTMITSIDNKFGKTIFESKQQSKNIVSEEAAFLISDILSDNNARAPTFGGSLNVAGHDVAVKTGTTDDYRDAWTIGYTPNLTVGVWVGNNNNEPMSFGGSTFAGPIWRTTMQRLLSDVPKEDFTRPAGVEQVYVCRSNGKRATTQFPGTYQEFFLRGTVPSGSCEPPKKEEPAVDTDEEKKKKEEEERKKREEAEREQAESTEDTTTEEPPTTEPQPETEDETTTDGSGTAGNGGTTQGGRGGNQQTTDSTTTQTQ